MIAKKVCAIGGATLDLIIAYEDMEMMTLENSDSARNYLLLEEGSKIEVSDLHYYSGGVQMLRLHLLGKTWMYIFVK